MRTTIVLLLAFGCCFASLSAAPATQPAPATKPADFEIHEWLVLVCDAFSPTANDSRNFNTTLPDFIDTRRKRAPATQRSEPCPIGVIRLIGSSDAKVDVKLELGGGRLMSAWPKAQSRSASVLWRDLAMSSAPARVQKLDEEHWLFALRGGGASYISSDSTSERFLLYDVEIPFALPLRIGLSADRKAVESLKAANAGAAPIYDLSFYKPDPRGGWRTGTQPDFAPGRKPATAPATAPASGPSTLPATAPADSFGVDAADVREIRLATSAAKNPPELLADWKPRLLALGVEPAEADVILRILEHHALDERRLTAVYRLADAELDRLLPLEVIPQPRKTVRVALVIVKNADPSVPGEIDDLIAQLGDRDWRKREEASKALAQLGAAAKPQLEAALKNSDQEIVLRAERLLAALK